MLSRPACVLRSLALLLVAVCTGPGPASGQTGGCWKRQRPSLPRNAVRDMTFTSALNGTYVGDGGMVARTTDGGYTWVPIEAPTTENLQALYYRTPTLGWAGGERGTLLQTTDGGFTWLPVALPDTLATVRSIHFPTADTGFAVGDSCIFRTVNGGQAWTRQQFAPPAGQLPLTLRYVHFWSRDTGYAYSSALFYRTTNGGATWTAATVPSFYTVGFATKKIGWGVTHGTTTDGYYKTIDGGVTWTFQYLALNYNWTGARMQVLDTATALVVGGNTGSTLRVHYTQDGGASWSYNETGGLYWPSCIYFQSLTNGHISNIWGSSQKTADLGASFQTPNGDTATGMYTAIRFADSLHGWASGANRLVRTVDGGTTWTPAGYSSYIWIDGIDFPSATVGYLAGGAYLRKTTDGGVTWSVLTAAPLGNSSCVRFFSPQFGLVGRPGAILRTTDGGATWTPIPFPANWNIKAIDHADSLHWFATCDKDTAYHILKSSDGGVSWTPTRPTTLPGRPTDVAVLDSTHFYYADEVQGVYRTSDKGATFSLAYSNYGGNEKLYTPHLSFIDTNRGYATSTNTNGTLAWYSRLCYSAQASTGPGSWGRSRPHTGAAVTAIHYVDSLHAWCADQFGNIFRYYPAGTCPPNMLPPMLTSYGVKGCAGTTASVTIANWGMYSFPYDTIRVQLLQGATVLQTLVPTTSGTVTVTLPAYTGSAAYTLRLKVSNPAYPSGLVTTVPVLPTPPGMPGVSIWRQGCGAGGSCCAPATVSFGLANVAALGAGLSIEVHQIRKNGSDTVIALNQTTTQLTALQDTVVVYYKLLFGPDVCPPGSVFVSDTLQFPVRPLLPAPAFHLVPFPNDTVCLGSPLVVRAQPATGKHYLFYQKSGTGAPVLLQSGADSILALAALLASKTVYCRVKTASCVVPDTVVSDTLALTALAPTAYTATLAGPPPGTPLCAGASALVLTASTAPPATAGTGFEFHRIAAAGGDVLLGTTPTPQWTQNAVAVGDRYWYRLVPPVGACALPARSDTLLPVVTDPAVPSISLDTTGNTLLAQPATSSLYAWSESGTLVPGATLAAYTPAGAGSYTVQHTVNGCLSPWSAPFLFAPPAPPPPPPPPASSGVGAVVAPRLLLDPNPAQAFVQVGYPGRLYSLSVYDAIGREVLREVRITGVPYLLRTAGLAPGHYVVQCQGSAGVAVARLVVDRN